MKANSALLHQAAHEKALKKWLKHLEEATSKLPDIKKFSEREIVRILINYRWVFAHDFLDLTLHVWDRCVDQKAKDLVATALIREIQCDIPAMLRYYIRQIPKKYSDLEKAPRQCIPVAHTAFNIKEDAKKENSVEGIYGISNPKSCPSFSCSLD